SPCGAPLETARGVAWRTPRDARGHPIGRLLSFILTLRRAPQWARTSANSVRRARRARSRGATRCRIGRTGTFHSEGDSARGERNLSLRPALERQSSLVRPLAHRLARA